MLTLLFALATVPAHAETLEVALADKVGVVRIPADKNAKLSMKGKGEGAEATWENTDSDAVSMVCGESKSPEDTFVEQLLLAVGEQKWALAPGASVQLSCPGDKPVVFTDVHDQEVARLAGPVKVTVESVKSKSQR